MIFYCSREMYNFQPGEIIKQCKITSALHPKAWIREHIYTVISQKRTDQNNTNSVQMMYQFVHVYFYKLCLDMIHFEMAGPPSPPQIITVSDMIFHITFSSVNPHVCGKMGASCSLIIHKIISLWGYPITVCIHHQNPSIYVSMLFITYSLTCWFRISRILNC